MTRTIAVTSNPIKPKPRLMSSHSFCIERDLLAAPLILPGSCEGVVNQLRPSDVLFTPLSLTLSPVGRGDVLAQNPPSSSTSSALLFHSSSCWARSWVDLGASIWRWPLNSHPVV